MRSGGLNLLRATLHRRKLRATGVPGTGGACRNAPLRRDEVLIPRPWITSELLSVPQLKLLPTRCSEAPTGQETTVWEQGG